MTYEEKRLRRKDIADRIENGESLQTVCDVYSVGASTVREACIEFGVTPPSESSKGYSQFTILKALLDGEHPQDLATRLDISYSATRQVAMRARKAGFVIPDRRYKKGKKR